MADADVRDPAIARSAMSKASWRIFPLLGVGYLIAYMVRLGVVASLASILVRSAGVRRMLLREERTLPQRFRLALAFAIVFGAGVATRIATRGAYKAVDLGLEGCLLAGILGGYFTGLIAGVLTSLPAMFFSEEYLTLPLLAAFGVLGGLIRDNTTKGSSGLPFLSEIPIIGALFGTKDDSKKRTELIVLLTPRVLRTTEDAETATQQLIEKLKATKPLLPK